MNNMICTLKFQKVKSENNQKIMLGSKLIAETKTGAKVYQSENNNVISIVYQDYMNHVILEHLVNQVLEQSGEIDYD